MTLVRDRDVIDSPWPSAEPDEETLILSFADWTARGDELRGGNAPLGIRLTSDQGADLIADDIDRFSVIELDFPTFKDGRAYSTARLLRERHGFRGELRAVGNVLRDQLSFMHRCGFNAFEVDSEDAADQLRAALQELGAWYQWTSDGRPTAAQLRRGRQPKRARG